MISDREKAYPPTDYPHPPDYHPPPGSSHHAPSVVSGPPPSHTTINVTTSAEPGASITEINLDIGYFKTLPGILKLIQLVRLTNFINFMPLIMLHIHYLTCPYSYFIGDLIFWNKQGFRRYFLILKKIKVISYPNSLLAKKVISYSIIYLFTNIT